MAMVRISPMDEDKVKQAVLNILEDWVDGYSDDEMERMAYHIVEAVKEA